jgi:prophage regulatory protein
MNRIVRQREALRLTGLSRVTLWRLERAKLFPQRRRIGRQAVGWLASDIDDWLASRPRGPKSQKQQAA